MSGGLGVLARGNPHAAARLHRRGPSPAEPGRARPKGRGSEGSAVRYEASWLRSLLRAAESMNADHSPVESSSGLLHSILSALYGLRRVPPFEPPAGSVFWSSGAPMKETCWSISHGCRMQDAHLRRALRPC